MSSSSRSAANPGVGVEVASGGEVGAGAVSVT